MLFAEDITLNINNVDIAVKTYGQKHDKPLIAVHGWLDNMGSFEHLAEKLQGIYLITVDLPGHGKSGHFKQGVVYTFLDSVRFIINVADALKLNKFSLMGHSLGGATASILAGSFKDRIEKLVLIDAIGPISEEISKAPDRLKQAILEYQSFDYNKDPSYYPDFYGALLSYMKVSGLSENEAMPIVKQGIAENSKGFYFTYDRRLTLSSMLYMAEEQIWTFLQSITAKTCIIRASSGLMTKPLYKAVLDKRVEQVKDIIEFEVDGNHHIHLQHPDKLAKIINNFF